MLQPRCGLLFIDWTSGDTLQMTGTATTDFNNTSMPGAQRVVVFSVAEWVYIPGAVPLAAPAPVLEHSPYNPRLLKEDPEQLQELQCVSVVDAAAGIKTFEITAPAQWREAAAAAAAAAAEAAAAAGPTLYEPGQFASFDFDLLQQGGEASSSTTHNRTCERGFAALLCSESVWHAMFASSSSGPLFSVHRIATTQSALPPCRA